MNDHPDWTPRLGCPLEQFAYNELKIIEDQCKHDDEDPETAMQMQHEMTKCIMHMIEAACDCEFSGGTIGYAMGAFKRLMDYKPLTPIYDVPKVWNQVDENGNLQCKRCPSLFKNSDGRAYIVDRNIFETKYHGTYSTGCPDEVAEPLVKFFGIPMKSAEDITFPFIDASSRYIKLNEFEYQIKDMCSDIYGIVHDVKPIPGAIFDPVGYIDTIFILKNGYVVYANCLKNFKSGINSTFKVFQTIDWRGITREDTIDAIIEYFTIFLQRASECEETNIMALQFNAETDGNSIHICPIEFEEESPIQTWLDKVYTYMLINNDADMKIYGIWNFSNVFIVDGEFDSDKISITDIHKLNFNLDHRTTEICDHTFSNLFGLSYAGLAECIAASIEECLEKEKALKEKYREERKKLLEEHYSKTRGCDVTNEGAFCNEA